MAEAKIHPEKLHLFHINIIESSIKDLPNKGKIPFSINVAHTIMHNLKDERIKIGLLIDFQTNSSETNNANAHFNIDFHFQVEELKNYFELGKKNEPIFAGVFIATLLGVSFSTARGIIYERLSNTNMQGMILPVVSPQKMLLQQMEEGKKESNV